MFILLIFVVISLEKRTAKHDDSNQLAKIARVQVTVLSAFATLSIIIGATSIISSILFRWPLDMSLNEDKTTNRYLASIKGYYVQGSSYFERDGLGWVKKSQKDNSVLHTFTEDEFTPDFLRLSDTKRNIKIRIPTQGGMLEWSLNEKFNDCDTQYCWGDVWLARMRR